MNVLVTGAAGNLGRLIIYKLVKSSEVKRIVGIDRKKFPSSLKSKRCEYYQIDICESEIERFLREIDVDVVVHLAFVLAPMFDAKRQWQINVIGSQNIFFAAERSGVRKLVFASSTNAYGAYSDNPEFLTEEDPLRTNPNIQYTVEKMVLEGILHKISIKNPNMIITILRPCLIVGPNIKNVVVNSFKVLGKMRLKVIPWISGSDPAIQLIHEDDVVMGFYRAIVEDHPGIFNLVGDGYISKEWFKKKGIRLAGISPKVIKMIFGLLWKLRIYNTDPNTLELLMHRWVASNEKIRSQWGFKFRYTSEQAMESMIRSDDFDSLDE
jgi:UDP-glucose 4-epimerase